MQKILYVFLALCLLQTAHSACADGTFTNPDAPANGKAACVQCFPGCTTCNSDSACITYIDKLKGIDRSDPAAPTPLCTGVAFLGTWGYNSKVDACDRCFDGCGTCAFDYDYCTSCKEGWDFDRSKWYGLHQSYFGSYGCCFRTFSYYSYLRCPHLCLRLQALIFLK
jgi:hypothetical protein